MLELLDSHFQFSLTDLALLDAPSLKPLDALLLCTTEGPALSADELLELQSWVHAGGALITSAFANWSAFGHHATTTVGWLGIKTVPHTAFLPRMTHDLNLTVGNDNPDARNSNASTEVRRSLW